MPWSATNVLELTKGLRLQQQKNIYIYIIKLHIIIYIYHQTPEGARTCLKQNTHTHLLLLDCLSSNLLLLAFQQQLCQEDAPQNVCPKGHDSLQWPKTGQKKSRIFGCWDVLGRWWIIGAIPIWPDWTENCDMDPYIVMNYVWVSSWFFLRIVLVNIGFLPIDVMNVWERRQ